MPDQKQPTALPSVDDSRRKQLPQRLEAAEETKHEADQETDDEENWSDEAAATKSVGHQEFVPRPKKPKAGSHQPLAPKDRRPSALKDPRDDPIGDSHSFFSHQGSHPGGQIASWPVSPRLARRFSGSHRLHQNPQPSQPQPPQPQPPQHLPPLSVPQYSHAEHPPLQYPPSRYSPPNQYPPPHQYPPSQYPLSSHHLTQHPPPQHPPSQHPPPPRPLAERFSRASYPQSTNPHNYYTYPDDGHFANDEHYAHPAYSNIPREKHLQHTNIPSSRNEHGIDKVRRRSDEEVQLRKERDGAQKREKRKEKFDQQVDQRVDQRVDQKFQSVKAELERLLPINRVARETQSDVGGGRLHSELREVIQDLVSERRMEGDLYTGDQMGVERDRLLLLGLRQIAVDKHRQQGGSRSYEGSVRDSLLEQNRGRLDIIPRWSSQSNPDEDIHSNLKRIVVDVVREVQEIDTAPNRILARNLAITVQPSCCHSKCNSVDMDRHYPGDCQHSNYGGSSGLSSRSSAVGQQCSQCSQGYQPSNYGGSSGLSSPSSYVAADSFNCCVASSPYPSSPWPQSYQDITHTAQQHRNWDPTLAPNPGAFQNQVNRNMNGGHRYFPANTQYNNFRNATNAPRGSGLGLGMESGRAPSDEHVQPRKPDTQTKRDKHRNLGQNSASLENYSSDEEDPYRRLPRPYTRNGQQLNEPEHILPRVPDPPSPSSNTRPDRIPVELRPCLDSEGRLRLNDQSLGGDIPMKTPKTAGPNKGAVI